MADFVGIEIAVIVVTASIILAGILFGVGRAFGYKRIEHFGIEELIQSIINAAIVGSFAAITELVAAISASIVIDSCAGGNVLSQLSCTLSGTSSSLFVLFQNQVQLLNIIGYYQSLALDFGAFSVSPFANLSSVSQVLSVQLLSINLIIMLVQLNSQITAFIAQNALALLFPVGLVLRTLFATRKIGGFLIALAIGLYIFYPTFILIFPNPQAEVALSAAVVTNFTSNAYYAAVPVIDLNDNYAIAGKLDVLSGRCNDINNSACTAFIAQQQNITNNQSADLSSDLTVITQGNNNAISKSLLYAVIAPIFSLIITIVFVKELASLLGSEIGIKTVMSI